MFFRSPDDPITRSPESRESIPTAPLVGVSAVIVDAGRVALIKRGKAPLLGEWSIPGGMLELGETVRQGAEREALEETGLVVRTTELLGVFDRMVLDESQAMPVSLRAD